MRYEPKKAYRAVFSDGEVVNRKSDRSYGAAWRVIFASGHVMTGFARSHELACKAANREAFAFDRKGARAEVVTVEVLA